MTNEEQLERWVAGDPVHNPDDDECCPDFSCCRGIDTIVNAETRERFAKACREDDDSTRSEMLGMFLGRALADHNVHVITSAEPTPEQ